MRALKAKISRGIPLGARVIICDNSGGKLLKVFAVKKMKGTKDRIVSATIGDVVHGSVVVGNPEMRKQVVEAVIVRQRKEYTRPNGTRVRFDDNAAVIIKDELGNPKGTLIKGPIAKEIVERWPPIAKIASIIV